MPGITPNHYGFELRSGKVVQTVAYSIREAIDHVETEHGSPVWRGRQLDLFDNLATPGRPAFLIARQRPLAEWVANS